MGGESQLRRTRECPGFGVPTSPGFAMEVFLEVGERPSDLRRRTQIGDGVRNGIVVLQLEQRRALRASSAPPACRNQRGIDQLGADFSFVDGCLRVYRPLFRVPILTTNPASSSGRNKSIAPCREMSRADHNSAGAMLP